MIKGTLKKLIICCVVVLTISAVYQFYGSNAVAASNELNKKRQKSGVAAELRTDKTGYKPGDNAVINGRGFQPFEEIFISVVQPDEALGYAVLRASWSVYADEKGDFSTDWRVPAGGDFTVKAAGSVTKQEIETFLKTPSIVVSGNPNCATLNASNDPAFAHITSNHGFKIDPPASGTFTYTNASGRVLTGGASADPNNTIRIYDRTSTEFSWSSTRPISAVIVKGGPNANVYPYNPSSFGDTDLNTVNNSFGISHIEVCFGPAPASIKIIKDAQPNTPLFFKFKASGQVNDDFSLTDNGVVGPDRIHFPNLTGFGAGNTVTISEDASAPYTLTQINCTTNGVSNNSVNIPARFVTIQLEPGENVVCTFVNAIVTSAKVTVGGQITDPFGRGLARTMVTLYDPQTTETRRVISNTFGYYRFDELEVGKIYTVTVQNKRFQFDVDSQSFTLNDAIENLNFVGRQN